MATIKNYTDLEQSRKLAVFLPLETADMYYPWDIDSKSFLNIPIVKDDSYYVQGSIPAWSLAALLNVLPNDNSKCTTITRGRYNTITRKYISGWCVYYNEINGANCMNVFAENPVDACVAMIESLHELNLL